MPKIGFGQKTVGSANVYGKNPKQKRMHKSA